MAVVVTLGGGLLLFLPARVSRWVWTIGPFNARFLGAVYLAEMAGGIPLVVIGRRFPARVVLPVALTFTGVVTLASFMLIGDFDFAHRGPWLWFVAYAGFVPILAWYVWRERDGPQPAETTPAWRRWFTGEGVALCAYGVGLLVIPDALTDFWPWEIDAFHGRIYSAIFLTFGVGSLMLAGRSSPVEYATIGLSRLVLGVLAVAGLVATDMTADRVDWAAAGSVVWTAGFVVIALVGAAMLLRRRTAGR